MISSSVSSSSYIAYAAAWELTAGNEELGCAFMSGRVYIDQGCMRAERALDDGVILIAYDWPSVPIDPGDRDGTLYGTRRELVDGVCTSDPLSMPRKDDRLADGERPYESGIDRARLWSRLGTASSVSRSGTSPGLMKASSTPSA